MLLGSTWLKNKIFFSDMKGWLGLYQKFLYGLENKMNVNIMSDFTSQIRGSFFCLMGIGVGILFFFFLWWISF